MIRTNKHGVIQSELPNILERLNIDQRRWLSSATQFDSYFKGLVGRHHSVSNAVAQFGLRQAFGVRTCKALLGS